MARKREAELCDFELPENKISLDSPNQKYTIVHSFLGNKDSLKL